MQETLLNFVHSLILQDYIIVWLSLFFWIMFCFIWTEKLHKSILGIILWLFIFSATNLTLFSLNDNDIWLSSFRTFFVNNRNTIAVLTIFLIPIFATIIPLNSSIRFKISDKKWINYFISFVLGFFYIPFLFSIFLSIINNRFLFSIDTILLENINNNFLTKIFLDFFSNSKVFTFLRNYDYIISLVIILYMFYEMTIWWIIKFLIWKIFTSKKAHHDEDFIHEEHSHWH